CAVISARPPTPVRCPYIPSLSLRRETKARQPEARSLDREHLARISNAGATPAVQRRDCPNCSPNSYRLPPHGDTDPLRARPLGLQDDDAIGDFADRRFLSLRNRGNDLILALLAAVREFLQFDLQVLGAGQFRNNGELDSRSFRGDGDGL